MSIDKTAIRSSSRVASVEYNIFFDSSTHVIMHYTINIVYVYDRHRYDTSNCSFYIITYDTPCCALQSIGNGIRFYMIYIPMIYRLHDVLVSDACAGNYYWNIGPRPWSDPLLRMFCHYHNIVFTAADSRGAVQSPI